MKLRLEIDGSDYLLDLNNGAYTFGETTGSASLVPAGPDAYSLLIGGRSHTVRLTQGKDGTTAYVGGHEYRIRVSDARDRRSRALAASGGALEIRSQMPGKIIKVLVEPGQDVQIGEGLIVVEAMKMQNEIKAQKSGKVDRIVAAEGATVGAGEVLLVIA